jgi:hypothetical protein
MTKPDPEVYKLGSGLHVVTDDVESVRKAARAARRGRNRLKAQKAAQRRTGGSKGKATWRGAVKAKKAYEWLMSRPAMQDQFGDKAIHENFLRRNAMWPK